MVIYLIANQIDLITTGEVREVTSEEGRNFVKKNNLNGYKETSARSGANVQEAFNDFCNVLYGRWKDQREGTTVDKPKIDLKPVVKPKPKKKFCYFAFLV